PSVLAVFKEKKDDLSDAWLMLAYTGDETRRLSREGAQIAEKKEELQTSLRSLEDKLKEYISDRYKQVVSILRRDLTVGKPCPVCRKIVGGDGVEDESAHDHTSEADKELNARLLEMEEQIRQTEETLSDLETKRIKQEGDLAGAKRDEEKAETAKEKTVADLNELLAAWDIQLAGDCDDTELSAVQKQLEQRDAKYQQANDAYTEADRKYRDLAGKLEAVDLKQAEITCIEAKQVAELALDDLRKIRDQRIELFGETPVKEAEKRFDAELLAKEADSKQKAEKLSTVREAIRSAESAGEQCAIRIGETIEKIKACEAAFSEALVRNGFADETEFLSCIVEPAQLQTLETEVRDYEKKKTAAETSLKDAKENLTKLQETPRTEESAESLQQNLQQLQAKMQDNNQRIGALEEILKNDDQNRIKRAEAEKRLEDVGKEDRIFARISEMLGKNDGSDFEVFVQSIAMKSLLAKANQYLSGIIPKYELVQKSGSIDFEVHETAGDGNVSVRQVSNFSGGERFIISLCLALAMSEFAGRNGDVECIFLDEGFGTLSGQPLLDAIDALKRLSSTGKMLGIITHIETVIQAFMPIEAVRKGDRSTLSGPGVTFTPA
nr:hypothetical protein [Lachnospiraceae bacterium]